MTNNAELKILIDMARKYGAIIRTKVQPPYDSDNNGVITAVQVRSGVLGCGSGWMPPIAATERLSAFLMDKRQIPVPKEQRIKPTNMHAACDDRGAISASIHHKDAEFQFFGCKPGIIKPCAVLDARDWRQIKRALGQAVASGWSHDSKRWKSGEVVMDDAEFAVAIKFGTKTRG